MTPEQLDEFDQWVERVRMGELKDWDPGLSRGYILGLRAAAAHLRAIHTQT